MDINSTRMNLNFADRVAGDGIWSSGSQFPWAEPWRCEEGKAAACLLPWTKGEDAAREQTLLFLTLFFFFIALYPTIQRLHKRRDVGRRFAALLCLSARAREHKPAKGAAGPCLPCCPARHIPSHRQRRKTCPWLVCTPYAPFLLLPLPRPPPPRWLFN